MSHGRTAEPNRPNSHSTHVKRKIYKRPCNFVEDCLHTYVGGAFIQTLNDKFPETVKAVYPADNSNRKSNTGLMKPSNESVAETASYRNLHQQTRRVTDRAATRRRWKSNYPVMLRLSVVHQYNGQLKKGRRTRCATQRNPNHGGGARH